MEVRDWLKRASDDGKKAAKQIVFDGERFDVIERALVAGEGVGSETIAVTTLMRAHPREASAHCWTAR